MANAKLPLKTNGFYQLMAPQRLPFWMAAGLFLLYLVLPEQIFWDYWGVTKVGQPWDMVYFGGCLLALWVGSMIGASISMRQTAAVIRPSVIPRWYIWIGLIVSLGAYLLWIGVGIARSGGMNELLAIRSHNPWYVKSVLMDTLPGLTTLTQVAVMAIPLMLTTIDAGPREKTITILIIFLGLFRSYLYSERLAFLELVLPSAFILLGRQPGLNLRQAVSWLLLGVVGVLLFFTIQEASRSFLVREFTGIGEILKAGVLRFAGYYLTSINTGFLFISEWSMSVPFYTPFRFIWHFPGLGGLYEAMTGATPLNLPAELAIRGLNPEYNTATAIGASVGDFGRFGAMFWNFAFGIISGLIWKRVPHSSYAAALYGVWLVGLLELMRIPYLSETRLFPAYVFLAIATLVFGQAAGTTRHGVGDRSELTRV